MATFDVAKLLNKITQDIPGINTALKALAKWDVSALTDVPDGAMQATTDTNNRLTIKKKVSDSYTPVAKLMHDVDLLDGYHASASETANAVAVRNAQGALPGNITGNAATAATAVALAAGSVVPLNQGGTEATTASQARTNLGAAGSADFTAHIAKQASSSVEGHVKLSDAVNSTSGVAGGIAATPAAAKSAYDKAVAGVNAAAAAQAAAGNAQTTANTAQAAADNAQTTANTAKAVTDKVSTTPAAGKIPLAGSTGKIDKDWMDWSAWATGLAGKANTDLSNATVLPQTILKDALSASGGAPVFACRAWVNFNGSAAAIRGSGNVSSVVRNGVGDYTVNFATAMPDAKYAVSAQAGTGNWRWIMEYNGTANTPDSTSAHLTTSCRFIFSNNASAMDNAGIYISFFR